MKTIFIIICIVFVLAVAWLWSMARFATIPELGLRDGHLKPCPDKPNCYLKQIKYSAPLPSIQRKIQQISLKLGGQVKKGDKFYWWATFKSKLFGFVDDVEFFIDQKNHTIQIRSAARTGSYDFGVNKKRVNQLANELRKNPEP